MACRVVLVTDPAGLQAIRERLRGASRVALDTEFHAEKRYLPKLYLLQLHLDDGTTWLVDALEDGAVEALAEPLKAIPWVVHGGAQDLRLLAAALGGVPKRVWDTQIAAGFATDLFPAAYEDLVARFLGRAIDKSASLTDWSRRPLSDQQIRYASADVEILLPLWDRLWAEVRAAGREEMVAMACAEALEVCGRPPTADRAWRDIPAAVVLTPPQAAILQELLEWRERLAAATNQPPRALFSDALLVDLARRQPISLESLAANRRLPKRMVRDHGPELVERIQRALQRPSWAWPRPIAETSPERRTALWLDCYVRRDGAARGYAARLALPRDLAEDLALDRPATRERLASMLGPWRDALVGDRLWDALRGESSMHLDSGDVALVP